MARSGFRCPADARSNKDFHETFLRLVGEVKQAPKDVEEVIHVGLDEEREKNNNWLIAGANSHGESPFVMGITVALWHFDSPD